MKPSLVVLLVLSLAGNAVLAVLAFRSPAVAAPAAAVATAKPAPAAAAPKPLVAAIPADTWRMLRPAGDLHGTIDNLRAAGFPPSVVRAVASQLLSDQFDGSSIMQDVPYWKRQSPTPEQVAAMTKLNTERREMYESLLGPDARPSATMTPLAREQRYGSLSDDKIDAIARIDREYNDVRSQAYSARTGTDYNDVMKQQDAIESEKRRDMAAVLSPEELEQYDLHSSRSAQQVMSRLKDVDLSEGEYKALVESQKTFDDTLALQRNKAVNGVTNYSDRLAAQDVMNDQARAALGDNRFFDYLKTSDPQFSQTLKFTSQYPAITTASAYDLMQLERTTQVAMQKMSQNPDRSVTPQQRALDMRAFLAAQEAKLQQILPADAIGAYKQQGSGRMFNLPGMRPGGP